MGYILQNVSVDHGRIIDKASCPIFDLLAINNFDLHTNKFSMIWFIVCDVN